MNTKKNTIESYLTRKQRLSFKSTINNYLPAILLGLLFGTVAIMIIDRI